MRVKRWTSLLVAGGTIAAVAGFASTAGAAGGAQTLNIGVGGDSVVSGVTFEGMRFDAPTLSVHKGDTLNFQFRGFHTATLLPEGINAEDWRAQHTGRGGDFSLVQPDGDDSPPAFQFNKAVLFPTDPSCGTSGNPCTYNGSALVSSGAPININSFSVTINANPGSSFWVICLIHGMMDLKVNVVPAGQAATSQAAINSYASRTLKADHEQAAALIPKLEKQTRHKIAGGGRVWDAFAGFDGNGWGLDGMFPKTLHIKKGQRVEWHFAQLLGNVHSVTFPRKAAVRFANDFAGGNMKCEGNPDTAVNAPPPTFCSSGIDNLEFELPAGAVVKVGSNKYGGHGLHSSGVRGADSGNVAPYTLKFTHRSSKRGFAYACNIHGGMMTGHVVVRR